VSNCITATATCASSENLAWADNRAQSIFGGTTEIQKEIIARSLGASGSRGSQVVLMPAAWRQASASPWHLKSLLRAVAAASASVACTWAVADVPGIWVCRAEAAEKFLGAQVVLGASHVFSLVTHCSP